MSVTIPSPPGLPVLGHIFSLRNAAIATIVNYGKQYGGIYELNFAGRKMIIVNTVDLVNDVSNDRKFAKVVADGSLMYLREISGDALFTANKDEPNWGIAHRLLAPMFRGVCIQDMFPDMYDICLQLILKWERFGPEYCINPTDDFGRLAMDIVVFCGMSYRLNSFYSDHPHPFMVSMSDALAECGARASRLRIVGYFMSGTNAKWEQDKQIMAELAEKIIADRKRKPNDKRDLLNVMLQQQDPKTGERLDDEAIRNNIISLLIAGHETTAAMLSFTLYYLIKHPEKMRKAQEEIDDALGDGQVQLGDLSKLKYLNAVIRESLRLGPPAPLRKVTTLEDTTIGDGKYFIPKGQEVIICTYMSQRDPAVWGPDAGEFRPERMLDGKFEAMPASAWQPFGFGSRQCIGRPFTWQEGQIVLTMMLQRFDFKFAGEEPGSGVKEGSLTIRPEDHYVHAIPRTRSMRGARV